MLKVITAGFNTVHTEKDFTVDRKDGAPDYLFLLFRSRAKIFLESETLTADSPAVMIYPKNRAYKYGYADEPFVNDWFHFDGGGAANLLASLEIPLHTLIFMDDFQTISHLIRDLEYEYHQTGRFRDQLLDAKIRVLLCKMACICHYEKNVPQSVNHYRKEFANIRNRIYQMHGPALSVAELAGELNMSASYFHHIYKSLFNIPPGRDIIKSRIEHACTLLRSEPISIVKVAERCHYSNVEHFIRQFRQYMKCSPGEYRKKYR